MNKKAFTLIELIAVVVIMSIIALIATPNIVKMSTNSKKEQYITDIKDFAIKARYMYKLEKYRNSPTYFTKDPTIDGTRLEGAYQIFLTNIKNVDTDDLEDPYNCTYDKNASYIAISNVNDGANTTLPTTKYIIYITTNCDGEGDVSHCIHTGADGIDDINLLDSSMIMEGEECSTQ